jgi:hypothetical protein
MQPPRVVAARPVPQGERPLYWVGSSQYSWSELELVDVCGSDDLGGAENHFTFGADRIFTKATRREFISFLAGDLAFG